MNIRILPADKLFSQFIRLRDKECVRCHSRVQLNDNELPISHQNSHYWGRANWSVRFDEKNCDTLCFACHHSWGGDYRRDYEAFKRKQLGVKGYRDLEIRKNSFCRRDPKLALIYVKNLYLPPLDKS